MHPLGAVSCRFPGHRSPAGSKALPAGRTAGGDSLARELSFSIECKSKGRRPVRHPLERRLRQGGVSAGPADVAVRPGEPDLLDGLPWLGPVIPKGCLEGTAPFVDGEGVAGVPDPPVQLNIVELVAAGPAQVAETGHLSEPPQGDAEGAHSVPDADEGEFRLRGNKRRGIFWPLLIPAPRRGDGRVDNRSGVSRPRTCAAAPRCESYQPDCGRCRLPC